MNRTWTAVACVVSCALVLLNLWDNRDLFDPEGITYLDMADAYRRGDWRGALIGEWSPLYPGLIALMLLVFDPAAQWEFAAVHALNFFVFLIALASFSVFLHELLRRFPWLPAWAWIGFGYALFTWSVIRMIPLHQPEPDLLVCAWVYLLFALLLRMRRGELAWAGWILFGVALALGYLTKGIMFPMAFVFAAVALVLALRGNEKLAKAGVAFAVFLMLSLPYAYLLSAANGRWMFSDAGRLNYAWDINQVEHYAHWQGADGVHGTPVHPTRKIHDDPPMYEFGTPFSTTYPPWYDPSYWYEGVELAADLPRQISVFIANAKLVFYFLASSTGSVTSSPAYGPLDGKDRTVGPLATLFCLMLVAALLARMPVWRAIAARWFLLAPIAAVFGAYALLHVEGRFLAAYVVVLWLALFGAVAIPWSEESKRFLTAALGSAAALTLFTLASESGRSAAHMARFPASRDDQPAFLQSGYSNWKVASYLRDAGVRPGDAVGSVAWSYSAYWARMARVRIVAEVPSPYEASTASWFAAEPKRAAVMERFRDLGVKAVVARHLPAGSAPASWRPVAGTGYHVYLFDEPRTAVVD